MSGVGEAGVGSEDAHAGDGEDTDYWELIRRLSLELAEDPADRSMWKTRAYELAQLSLRDPDDFLAWARRHHHLSFTMAEVIVEVQTGHAHDLAHRLMAAILCEVLEQNASTVA